MGRVALVTGGSRGIGAAISVALKAAGCTVAANYAGNDEAAAKFTAETGIKTYKWNVADYEASAAGIATGRGRAWPRLTSWSPMPGSPAMRPSTR
jgi:acetoacetyl-CoA reductase